MHGAVTQRLGQNLGLASSVKDSLRLITVAFLLSPKKIKTGLNSFWLAPSVLNPNILLGASNAFYL